MLTQWAAKHSMLAQRRRFALGVSVLDSRDEFVRLLHDFGNL